VQSVSSDADESVSRKWSAGQSAHAARPCCVWIWPAGHAGHAAADPVALLAVPAGHTRHALKSAALLYWPAGQGAHACPASGAYPAGQPAVGADVTRAHVARSAVSAEQALHTPVSTVSAVLRTKTRLPFSI